MKQLFVCLAILVFAAFSASAGIINYTDEAAFLAAAGSITTETFTGALGADVSVVTTNGTINGGMWVDQVTTTEATTTWVFANSIYAWGATFNLGEPGGPGHGLVFFADGTSTGYEIPNTTIGGFYGFISDTPFSQVLVSGGTQEGWTERYYMDNMDYGGVPEPGSLALMFAGLAAVALRMIRRK